MFKDYLHPTILTVMAVLAASFLFYGLQGIWSDANQLKKETNTCSKQCGILKSKLIDKECFCRQPFGWASPNTKFPVQLKLQKHLKAH